VIVVLTTIGGPSDCTTRLVEKLQNNSSRLIVVGDRKGPERYSLPSTTFLSLKDQMVQPFDLVGLLPTDHYTRKNIGYLVALSEKADCIYETDDDNAPLDSWRERSLTVSAVSANKKGWVNAYRFFTDDFIWPRGLPLDQVRDGQIHSDPAELPVQNIAAPIQQGLADDSPDVDAVWRLLHDKPITFERNPSVHLEPGTWCPFNSQSTWWWPEAYPLMYLPSYCSFRMTDIWRSFVAQRCLWELGHGVVFHASDVYQERNPHDLMKDFEAEIPGYRGNQAFVDVLKATSLKSGRDHAIDNLVRCYERLIEAGFFPDKEMQLVHAWAQDIEPLIESFEDSE